MQTRVITLDPQAPDFDELDVAAHCLRRGGLVAFPTETVYGLGANALDGDALAKIFAAKQRPKSDPIIAHIAELDQLGELATDIPDSARELAAVFWPGPLTLILKRHPAVPELIAEGRSTVAVRMPAHPIAHELLRRAQRPIGAPSANRFTRPSATLAAHVIEDLDGRIDLVIDGGPATIGVESTVLDLSGRQPVVLRPGGLSVEAIQQVLPEVMYQPAQVSEREGHQSPGQLLKHYSPRAALRLFRGADHGAVLAAMAGLAAEEMQSGHRVGALLTQEDVRRFVPGVDVEVLGSVQDPDAQARVLFAAMRRLDARGVDLIVAAQPSGAGLERALGDRLFRAAEGQFIEV